MFVYDHNHVAVLVGGHFGLWLFWMSFEIGRTWDLMCSCPCRSLQNVVLYLTSLPAVYFSYLLTALPVCHTVNCLIKSTHHLQLHIPRHLPTLPMPFPHFPGGSYPSQLICPCWQQRISCWQQGDKYSVNAFTDSVRKS